MKIRHLIILAFCLVLGYFSISSFSKDVQEESPTKRMNGLCWVAGDSIAQHNIDAITNIGADWISQTPFGWMKEYDEPNVWSEFHRGWWGETDKGLIHTAELARESGVKTMLKPHIWLKTKTGKWRSDIAMNSDEEWQQWFDRYREWILHYAEVAERSQMEALCIGTELHQTTTKHPDQWRRIIAEIRKVYSGKLIYAANWYKEYEEITFWDDLDYIGIQAYFPLTKKEFPSKKDLKKGWQKHIKDLKSFSKKYNRKIVFTEIGYKNTSDSAKEPWVWPRQVDKTVKISEATQIACYEALFEALENENWLDGIFIWKWFHSTYKYESYLESIIATHRHRDDPDGWKKPRPRFSPQRNKTLETLKKWYGGRISE